MSQVGIMQPQTPPRGRACVWMEQRVPEPDKWLLIHLVGIDIRRSIDDERRHITSNREATAKRAHGSCQRQCRRKCANGFSVFLGELQRGDARMDVTSWDSQHTQCHLSERVPRDLARFRELKDINPHLQHTQSFLKHFHLRDGSLTVDVCDVTSVDRSLWGEWVPVVIPAYGLGYVRSVHLVDVHWRPPAEPFLTSLQLGDYSYHRYGTTAFTDILRLVGRNLKSLDITKCHQFRPVKDLRDALKTCWSLESLALTNSGDLWCETGFLPRLRELHLVVERGRHHLGSMQLSQSLEILTIHAPWYTSIYSESRDAVKRLLTQLRNLRVFHWQEGLSNSHTPTPYTETCADTTKRLQELGLDIEQRRTNLSPLSATQVLAFLSAVSSRNANHSHGRLDQEVIQQIIAFARAPGERVIVLEPSGAEIPRHRRRPRPI